MAMVNLPPHQQAELERERAVRAAMSSPDPVVRWAVKENSINRAMEEAGAALMDRARANAKALANQEREAQRAEMEFYSKRYRIKK